MALRGMFARAHQLGNADDRDNRGALDDDDVIPPMGGIISFRAWGSTTYQKHCKAVMPTDRPASACPLGTASIAARTISAT